MILNCPFCENTVTPDCIFYQEQPRRAKTLRKVYFVKCPKCSAKGPSVRTMTGAVRVWNKAPREILE